MNKKRLAFYSVLAFAAILSGCGKTAVESPATAESPVTAQEPVNAKPVSAEPLTLKVYQNVATISDEDFQQYIAEPVKRKYPNITLELVKTGTGTMPEDLLAAGDFPDLIYTSATNIGTFKVLKVAADLNEYVKKNNMDLNRFDPAIINTIKQSGNGEQLYGIPYTQNVGVLAYNKDLFEKFGEKAPTDGMSWSQVIELGRTMTRTEGGVRYIGFDPATVSLMGLGLSLPYVDPKTNKATINNESWQKIYQTFKAAYEIPGYVGPDSKFEYGVSGIVKEQNLAMTPVWLNGFLNNVKGKNLSVDWDLVSLPNFEEAIGTGREVDTHLLMMSDMGKHKDQAFQVMEVISSDENQMNLSKNGRISVLNNAEIKSSYAANLPEFKGKNIAAIFKTKPRVVHTPSTDYDTVVRKTIDDSAKELALTGVDINTLLRTTEEKANAAIQAAK